MNEFVNTDLFKFDSSDGKWSLGEIIYKGKIYRHGGNRMATLLGDKAPEDVLEVRLVHKAGFYDVADATEMASYVKANAEKDVKFDSAYWIVSDAGVVTWRNLAK